MDIISTEVAIWTSLESAKAFMESAAVKEESATVLRNYIDWWLKGDSLHNNDLNKRMEETGILDPIEDIVAVDSVGAPL